VRRVYEMYTVEGCSIGEITRWLNAEGGTSAGRYLDIGQECLSLPVAKQTGHRNKIDVGLVSNSSLRTSISIRVSTLSPILLARFAVRT